MLGQTFLQVQNLSIIQNILKEFLILKIWAAKHYGFRRRVSVVTGEMPESFAQSMMQQMLQLGKQIQRNPSNN